MNNFTEHSILHNTYCEEKVPIIGAVRCVDTLSVTPAKCRQMETLSGKQSPAMCHPTSK